MLIRADSKGSQVVSRTTRQLAAQMSLPHTLNIGMHLFYSKLLGDKPTDADSAHQKAVLETLHLLDEKALERTLLVIHGRAGIEPTFEILKKAGINVELLRFTISPLGEINDNRYIYTFQSKGNYSQELFYTSPQIWDGLERVNLFGCTEMCVGNARNSLLALQQEKGKFEIKVPSELLLLSFQYWGTSHLLSGF